MIPCHKRPHKPPTHRRRHGRHVLTAAPFPSIRSVIGEGRSGASLFFVSGIRSANGFFTSDQCVRATRRSGAGRDANGQRSPHIIRFKCRQLDAVSLGRDMILRGAGTNSSTTRKTTPLDLQSMGVEELGMAFFTPIFVSSSFWTPIWRPPGGGRYPRPALHESRPDPSRGSKRSLIWVFCTPNSNSTINETDPPSSTPKLLAQRPAFLFRPTRNLPVWLRSNIPLPRVFSIG